MLGSCQSPLHSLGLLIPPRQTSSLSSPTSLLQTLRKKFSPRQVLFGSALFMSPRLLCQCIFLSPARTSHPCSLPTSNFFTIDFNTVYCVLLSNRQYFLKCPKFGHPIKCKGEKGLTWVLSVIYTFTLRLRL